MKAASYSPYLDAFGGGERYILTIAEILAKTFSVDLLLDDHLFFLGSNLKNVLSKRFNLDLSKVNIIHAPIGKSSNIIQRALFLKKYDVLFYLTDGSIFYPTAKKNILHLQSPVIGQPHQSIWGKLKLKGWDLIIYNSNFTKLNAENYWLVKSKVIYPPVDVIRIKPLKKKKYILSVGRFSSSKKQELLIKVFKDLCKDGQLSNWSLSLAGSASEGDQIYLQGLQRLAEGLPIKFYPNLGYEKLVTLYGQSSIYWHAAGFAESTPSKMEHFGISTVEAMAAGCAPVVINKGGQPEIVVDGKSGFLWNTLDQLKQITIQLSMDKKLLKKISKAGEKRAQNFSKQKFEEQIKEIIK